MSLFYTAGRAIRASLGSKNAASMIWAMGQVQNCKGLVKKSVEWLVTGGLVIFGLWLLCYLGIWAVGLYKSLDNSGWIAHNHDTPVWIQGDWLVGEYRVCGLRTTAPLVGVAMSQAARAGLPRLLCGKSWENEGVGEFEIAMPDPTGATDALFGKGNWITFDSYFHVLPVRYYGRTDRPESVFVSWRCQRNSASLTCWALN